MPADSNVLPPCPQHLNRKDNATIPRPFKLRSQKKWQMIKKYNGRAYAPNQNPNFAKLTGI